MGLISEAWPNLATLGAYSRFPAAGAMPRIADERHTYLEAGIIRCSSCGTKRYKPPVYMIKAV